MGTTIASRGSWKLDVTVLRGGTSIQKDEDAAADEDDVVEDEDIKEDEHVEEDEDAEEDEDTEEDKDLMDGELRNHDVKDVGERIIERIGGSEELKQ